MSAGERYREGKKCIQYVGDPQCRVYVSELIFVVRAGSATGDEPTDLCVPDRQIRGAGGGSMVGGTRTELGQAVVNFK